MKYISILSIIFISINAFSQKDAKLIREGNRQYDKKVYSEAEITYRKALEKEPLSVKGLFNLGDALYEQGKYEEAAGKFTDLTQKQIDKDLKAYAYHNLGNAKLNYALNNDTLHEPAKQQKIRESIEAYKNALKLNPNDQETKYNLVYAQKMLKKGEGQGQGQNQQNQDQQKQDQNKQDQNKENKDDKNQQQGENQEQKQDEQKKQGQQGQQKNISKEEAEKMLEALKNSEQNTLDRVKKEQKQGVRVRIDKDW